MSFPRARQSGGTFLGLVLGVVLGLGVALAVALYVTKAPVPFVDRGILGSADDGDQELRNKNWNPNASYNQNSHLPEGEQAAKADDSMPNAIAAVDAPPTIHTADEALGTDPLGDLIQQKSASEISGFITSPQAKVQAPLVGPAGQVQDLVFYVQAGAFSKVDDADNQRAKLALLGVDTRVSQDTVNSRVVFRVRSGPYKTRSKALETRQRLTDQNIESVVVAVAN